MHSLRTAAVLALIAALLVVGCTKVGPVQTETQTVDLEGATTARAEVVMGAGRLRVSGGAAPEQILNADFTYNVAAWQPEIDYRVSDGRGTLSVQQPTVTEAPIDGARYEWDLRFNEAVPTELYITLGAGESAFDLGTLSLTWLDITMGAGNVSLDLAELQARDLDAQITGGVGKLMVQLPSEVGVRVEVRGGLGRLLVTGLTREDNTYYNDAYGTAEQTLRMRIDGGVGEIELKG
jgi:hypothetical protein